MSITKVYVPRFSSHRHIGGHQQNGFQPAELDVLYSVRAFRSFKSGVLRASRMIDLRCQI